MKPQRTQTAILIKSLKLLAQDIQSTDGVANAAILEGAQRMEELRELLEQCQPLMAAHAESLHMLEGFGPRKKLPEDELVQRIQKALR